MAELNMISQIRRQITFSGKAELDVDSFNKLQAEWIKRTPLPESEAIKAVLVSEAHYKKRLEECLGALMDVYDSGVNLMEHENTVRQALKIID